MMHHKLISVLCVIVFLMVNIEQSRTSYGDSCTNQDASNCTSPQMICSPELVCNCSAGYLPDRRSTANSTGCRKPSFNEKCNVSIGCQVYQVCTNVSGNLVCQCENTNEYYDPRSDRCTEFPVVGQRCNLSIGCLKWAQCVDSPPGLPTCNCNSSDVYLDDINSMCLPVSYLAVGISSTEVTSTSVSFKWDGQSPESGVEYNILWQPPDGHISFVYPLGGQVDGLKPGTHYNFSIESSLFGGFYSSLKRYLGPNITICTDIPYGGLCGNCGKCEDVNTSCVQAMDGKYRCICGETFFRTTPTGNCSSLDALTLNNIQWNTTSMSAIFTWQPKLRLDYVTYNLQWYPSGGNLDRVNSTGAAVSHLSPGDQYYFSVSAIVAPDNFTNQKTVTSPEVLVNTHLAYLSYCSPSDTITCEEPTVCTTGTNGRPLCMCDAASYFSEDVGKCASIENLKAKNLSVFTMATTVILNWASLDPSEPVSYYITWSPAEGQLTMMNSSSAEISGLTSKTQYNFTIVCVLPAQVYYPEKRVSVQVPPVTTKRVYNETCDSKDGCPDDQTCMEVNGVNLCRCFSEFQYYNVSSDRCVSRPSFYELCNATTGCSNFLVCWGSPLRCQCNQTVDYYDSISGRCVPLADLEVSAAITQVTSTMVSFRWAQDDPERAPTYNILWTPPDGGLDFTGVEGGQVSGLQPGHQYNFTIVSVASGGQYYPDIQHYGPNITVCTKVPYSGNCSLCKTCEDNSTVCVPDKSGTARCLCGGSFYNRTSSGNCSALSDLAVKITSSNGTTSTVVLVWPAGSSLIPVSYTLQWYPHTSGHLDWVNTSGGAVSQLSPGVTYYFSVTSVVPADGYNSAKNTTSPEYLFRTELPYLGSCVPYTNEECQDRTVCLQSVSGTFICMCPNTTYFSNRLSQCVTLENLKVSGVKVTVTAETAVVNWMVASQPDTTVQYSINWSPLDGKLSSMNGSSALVSGLKSKTIYSFSVASILPRNSYYPEKSVVSVAAAATTGSEPESSGNKVGVAVGVSLASVAVISTIIVVIILYRRGAFKRSRPEEQRLNMDDDSAQL